MLLKLVYTTYDIRITSPIRMIMSGMIVLRMAPTVTPIIILGNIKIAML
jgi:hypothetical protein